MPTGFTAAIEDGSVTTLRDYAYHCAHAFIRDESDGSPSGPPYVLPDPSVPDYYIESVTKAEAEMIRFCGLSSDELRSEYEAASEKAKNGYEEWISRERDQFKRYKDMMSKIDYILGPREYPEEIKEFLQFMVNQIKMCMKDPDERLDVFGAICDYPLSGFEEWVSSHKAELATNLSLAHEQLAKQRENVRKSKAWLAMVRDVIESAEAKIAANPESMKHQP